MPGKRKGGKTQRRKEALESDSPVDWVQGEWPGLFCPIESLESRQALEAELTRELKPGHVLFGLPVAAVARCLDQDDVVFELLDGSNRIAQVHLTWAGEHEKPPWPETILFDTLAAWMEVAKA